jgi:hypothetical protein
MKGAWRVRLPLVAAAMLLSCDGQLVHLGDGRGRPDAGPDLASVDGDADGALDSTTDTATPCSHGTVAANEVLWIGDSWILVPGSLVTNVATQAQSTGAIGASDQYAVAAAAATSMASIVDQYKKKAAPRPRVLIMDGGTWDTITLGASDTVVQGVASTFTQFLDQVAKDGTVQHVIYFLPPELPKIIGVAALRPLLQTACAQSAVPCHFIDLQMPWMQPLGMEHPEYTMDNGILPTTLGTKVLSDLIWATMQQSCIAQ